MRYTWTREQGFIDARFQRPPTAVQRKLEIQLEAHLNADDARIGSAGHAIGEALLAKQRAQPMRAEKLLRLALELEPWNQRAATILCSLLRQVRRAHEAVEVAASFPKPDDAPLLTTRAAALIDIGDLDEAERVARWAYRVAKEANANTGEIGMVFKRIKAQRAARS